MTICFEYHPSQRPLINVVVDQHSLAFCFPLIASSVSCNWFIYHCSRPVSTDTRHWFNQSNDLTLEDVHKLVKSVNSPFFFLSVIDFSASRTRTVHVVRHPLISAVHFSFNFCCSSISFGWRKGLANESLRS